VLNELKEAKEAMLSLALKKIMLNGIRLRTITIVNVYQACRRMRLPEMSYSFSAGSHACSDFRGPSERDRVAGVSA